MGVNKALVNKVGTVWLSATLTFLLLVTAGWSQDEPAKLGGADGKPARAVATMNSPRLDKEYVILSKHVAAIEAEKEEIQAEVMAVIDEVKSEVERMKVIREQLEEAGISNEKKRELVIEHEQLFQIFQKKNREAGELRSKKMAELAKRSRAQRDVLLKKVRAAIAQVTKERNIVSVMEYSRVEERGEVVWYADDDLDITDEVLKILNSASGQEEVEGPGE